MSSSGKRLFIVTNAMTPLNKSSEVTLSKFIRVVHNVYDEITVAGGNVTLEKDLDFVHIESYEYLKNGNKLEKLRRMFKLQKEVSNYLRDHVGKGDHVIFWLGDKMLLPFSTAKKKTDHVGYFVYGNLATEKKGSMAMNLSAKLVMHMANHADRVFVESKSIRQEWGGQIKQETYDLHLYSDEIRFAPIENRKNKIGMLCRLASVKHVIESINAFHLIHAKYNDWSLELIGSGVQEKECLDLIRELNAEDYIKVFGWMEKEKVGAITDEWKYGMLASDHEGLPNSVIELMGKGIPMIVHPVGGIPDLLKDEENGFTLNGVTIECIQDGLKRALEAKNYHELSENAFETVYNKYTLKSAQEDAAVILSNW